MQSYRTKLCNGRLDIIAFTKKPRIKALEKIRSNPKTVAGFPD